MLEAALLDNDVVLKMCAYRAGSRLVTVTSIQDQPAAILRVASFALRAQVRTSRAIADRDKAAEELEIVLAAVQVLEPTEMEIDYAADLEERALELGLNLDPGESQLVAILLHRAGPLLVTGDKRALLALAAVAPPQADGRMACLEQVVSSAIADEHLASLRDGVCTCQTIDKAVTNCFACRSTDATREGVLEGLQSYIEHLRQNVGRLLIPSSDLVAIPAKEHRVGLEEIGH